MAHYTLNEMSAVNEGLIALLYESLNIHDLDINMTQKEQAAARTAVFRRANRTIFTRVNLTCFTHFFTNVTVNRSLMDEKCDLFHRWHSTYHKCHLAYAYINPLR